MTAKRRIALSTSVALDGIAEVENLISPLPLPRPILDFSLITFSSRLPTGLDTPSPINTEYVANVVKDPEITT